MKKGEKMSAELKKKIIFANTGKKRTPEQRLRMSLAHMGIGVGQKRSQETKEKLRIQKLGAKNPQFGKHRTASQREYLSAVMRNRFFSQEHRRKLSEASKGRIVTDEARKNMSLARTGKKLSEQHRRNIGLAGLGRKDSAETRAKKRGRKVSIESRKKMSAYWKANAHKRHNWKGGNSKTADKKIRTSLEYKLWREAVFERDNWTCVLCKQRGGTLNADHIKPFAYFPALRFATDNGRTLCVPCHRTTDTYAGKGFKRARKRLTEMG